jgi:hypothetical protein
MIIKRVIKNITRTKIMSDKRVNFHLCENTNQRCYNCKQVCFDSHEAAYCMNDAETDATPPDQGIRVNENFVCDLFTAK